MFSLGLKIEKLSKRYGKGLFSRETELFRDVSFKLEAGKTFGLTGPSGTGKSTLGKIIVGLEKPSQGDVFYKGSSIFELRGSEKKVFRRKVQMMFQDPLDAFNPRKKIERSLLDILSLLKIPGSKGPDKIRLMLKTVGLNEEVLLRFPAQLSGGQLQRLALGRILLLEPAFIILDEPTSALDVSVQAQILQLLKKVQAREKLGYLLISHDEAVVRFMADYCGKLEHGSLSLA
ncbi:MAG: dipeptide/oligopeptide/nickel ABC transporter ATP-binding protein [Methanosarcinaceae archaeon]|nr:dipeptide/oligopeptide/nickel ABC transporter ATP-binding protein [Methanosarcinaceae archaeon]